MIKKKKALQEWLREIMNKKRTGPFPSKSFTVIPEISNNINPS